MKGIFAACILVLLSLVSCAAQTGFVAPPPHFPYELTGSISAGELTLEGTLLLESESRASLSVSAPAQLAGYSWTKDGESCTVSHSGVGAPLALAPPALTLLAEAVMPEADSLISAGVTGLGGQSYTLALYKGSFGEISVYYAPSPDGAPAMKPVRVEYCGVVMNITG